MIWINVDLWWYKQWFFLHYLCNHNEKEYSLCYLIARVSVRLRRVKRFLQLIKFETCFVLLIFLSFFLQFSTFCVHCLIRMFSLNTEKSLDHVLSFILFLSIKHIDFSWNRTKSQTTFFFFDTKGKYWFSLNVWLIYLCDDFFN